MDDPAIERCTRALDAWAELICLLPPTLGPDRGEQTLSHVVLQHYPYFEATMMLAASLRAGFAGHPRVASMALRPFIEMTMAQVWAHGTTKRTRHLRQFLVDGTASLKFGNMRDEVFSEERFKSLDGLREETRSVYSLTCNPVHVHSIAHSMIEHRPPGNAPDTSAEQILWYIQMGQVVHHALTLMVLRYPLSLFPVSTFLVQPMGFFARDVTTRIIEVGLGEWVAPALKMHLAEDDELQIALGWYEQDLAPLQDSPENAWSELAKTWKLDPRAEQPVQDALLLAAMSAQAWAAFEVVSRAAVGASTCVWTAGSAG